MSAKTIIIIFFSVIIIGLLGVYIVVNYTKTKSSSTDNEIPTTIDKTEIPNQDIQNKTEDVVNKPKIENQIQNNTKVEKKVNSNLEIKKSINSIDSTTSVEKDFEILDYKINTLK